MTTLERSEAVKTQLHSAIDAALKRSSRQPRTWDELRPQISVTWWGTTEADFRPGGVIIRPVADEGVFAAIRRVLSGASWDRGLQSVYIDGSAWRKALTTVPARPQGRFAKRGS